MRQKTGGRQKGTPNKKTAARKAQEAAIAAEIEDARSRGIEPLDYMLGVMRDVTADVTRRDAMAKAAAPYSDCRALICCRGSYGRRSTSASAPGRAKLRSHGLSKIHRRCQSQPRSHSR